MALKPEPVFRAVEYLTHKTAPASRSVVMLTPQGELFTQDTALRLSRLEQIVFICGRYEGVDERVTETMVDEEISIGDYVLSGGEIPAMVLVEAITRLIPGVLGDRENAEKPRGKRDIRGRRRTVARPGRRHDPTTFGRATSFTIARFRADRSSG